MDQAGAMALTIAGSDSSGGAGIQVDLKTFTVLGVYGASVLTAITAQNTVGVRQVSVLEPDWVTAQVDAVIEDLSIRATKTGMLANAALIRAVAGAVQRHAIDTLVVDPVMVAKSGDPLIDAEAVGALRELLLPRATVITPNRHEAARLLDAPDLPRTLAQGETMARRICDRFGCNACVVKKIIDGNDAVDVLYEGGQTHLLRGPMVQRGGTHGSGCAFSAAITAYLARGETVRRAVELAKQFIQHAIARAPARGKGTWPVDPLTFLGRTVGGKEKREKRDDGG